MEEGLLVGLAAVVVLAVAGQVIAARLRVPSILVLLIAGLVAGPVTGVLDPDALLGDLIFPVVALAVSIILFEGGLLLNIKELRGDTTVVVRRLLVIGVPVTAVSGALLAHFALGISMPISALLGAVLTVSGPTVVLPLLRFIRPDERVEIALKWEGIFVDAIGAALTVIAFEAVLATGRAPSPPEALLSMAVTLGVGAALGVAGAFVLVLVLDSDIVDTAIEPAVTIMVVLVAYVSANLLRSEAGLFTAIVMGVVLANQRRIEVDRIAEFKETLGMLLTGALFILLSARLDMDSLIREFPAALALTAVLVLLVRPLATALSTAGSDFAWQERSLIAWMYPRGIVAAATASLFAFELGEADVADVERLVPLTFLVILLTVAIYGLTGQPLARVLGVAGDTEEEGDDEDAAGGRDDTGTDGTAGDVTPDEDAAHADASDGNAGEETAEPADSDSRDGDNGGGEDDEDDDVVRERTRAAAEGESAPEAAAKDVATGLGMDPERG